MSRRVAARTSHLWTAQGVRAGPRRRRCAARVASSSTTSTPPWSEDPTRAAPGQAHRLLDTEGLGNRPGTQPARCAAYCALCESSLPRHGGNVLFMPKRKKALSACVVVTASAFFYLPTVIPRRQVSMPHQSHFAHNIPGSCASSSQSSFHPILRQMLIL